ncbi:MAG: TonB-dependent receptor, partial [Planctomycetes bacterium]|nr:TonB-dependent receptor [Planctomycetota bacterium]
SSSKCDWGEELSRGAEAEVEVRPTERVRVRGNWTHLFTRVTDTRTTGTAFVRGEPLLRRPRNAGSATVSLTPTDEWELTFTLISVGDRTDRDFKQASAGVRVENPDYRTVDAAVSWKFRPGWRAFAAGRNLTDATYEEAYGFPADRSNFLAGVEVAFRY